MIARIFNLWRPMSSAPLDGTTVLLYFKSGAIWPGFWRESSREWNENEDSFRMLVGMTHWKRMPKPPKSL